MALIRLQNGTVQPVPHDKAVALWKVLQGEEQGTPEQQAFCEKVKAVYLDWRRAPQSYVQANRDVITKLEAYHNITVIQPATEPLQSSWYDKERE